MILKKNQKVRILYLTVILIGLLLNVIIFNQNVDQSNYTNDNNYSENRNIIYQENDVKTQGTIEEEYTVEWLQNGNFTDGVDPWVNTTDGDETDINATYSNEAANYEILGEVYTYSLINGTPSEAKGWYKSQNTQYPAEPNLAAEFRSGGVYARHHWSESEDQQVIAQWDKTIDMHRNMSDYIVTAASLNITVNATVHSNPGYSSPSTWGGLDVAPSESQGGSQFNVGDYIRYFITISDIDKNKVYPEALSYQTSGLGADHGSGNQYDYLYDYTVVVDDENDLIFILNNLFQNYNDQYLNITIGMFLNCEDNWSSDDDFFEDIYITSVNFTFTYKKKIDRDTSLSWNQIGNKISGSNVDIVSATLNFNYTVDQPWPSDSPNAEFRVIINGTQFSETIRLSKATTNSQEAKLGGFDVGYLIMKDVNISLSLQVFLADEFELDQVITISIDDVSLNITYSVSTLESPTEFFIYLNGIEKTLDKSIEIPWRETINITVTYKNVSGDLIIDAEVDLNGTGISEVLSPSGTGNYSIVINSTMLVFGNNYLTLHAERKYFETLTDTIKITVIDRPTSIGNVMLNQVPGTSKQMQYNELLNISLSYNDTLNNGNFLNGATVAVNGSGISEPLAENSQKEYYTVVVNSADMDVGIKFLTVTAEKDNYTQSSVVLTITVSYKDTYLEVFIDNKSTKVFSYYNVSIGALLNFTVRFKENITDAFIDNADVKFIDIESGAVTPIPKHPFLSQYNLTINTTDLGSGFKFIEFTAEKEYYTSITVPTALLIQAKASEIELFLNGTPTSDNKNIEVEIYDTINVTVTFKDALTKAHLSEASGANVKFSGGDNFTENPALKYYNYTLNALDLKEGTTIFTIIAKKPNYISSSIQFIVEVTKKLSNLTLWFNGVDVTIDPSIELPIGTILNVTANFTDNRGIHISGADIELEVGYTANLTEGFGLYSVIIDTNLLDLGVNIISLTAQRANFEIQAENLRLLMRRIRTKIDTDDGEDTIEIRPGESITIKIEIENLDFGGKVKGADVTYDSKLGDGDLDEEDDGIYEFTLDEVPEGTYTIEITVFKEGGQYEFEDFEITLIVKRPAEENLLFLILFIIAAVVSVSLAGYLIAYQRILKYPKPVRKVRKYRRTLRKKNAPSVDIIGREKAFKSIYSGFIGTNLTKGKTSTEIAESEKMVKNSLKSSIGVISKKPIEKSSIVGAAAAIPIAKKKEKLKIVILEPHPIDLLMSSGPMIFDWIEEGHDIHVITITDGRTFFKKYKDLATKMSEDDIADMRIIEAKKAIEFLKIPAKNLHTLDFENLKSQTSIKKGIERIKPLIKGANRILLPSNKNNDVNHQATYDIVRKVAQDLKLDLIDYWTYFIPGYGKFEEDSKSKLISIKIPKTRRQKLIEWLEIYQSQKLVIENWQEYVKSLSTAKSAKYGIYKFEDLGNYQNF